MAAIAVDEYPLLKAEPDANVAHLLTGKPACISLLAPRYRKAELLGSDFSTLNLWRHTVLLRS
jgi:hypothetical protein